jgi:hypothetical protein
MYLGIWEVRTVKGTDGISEPPRSWLAIQSRILAVPELFDWREEYEGLGPVPRNCMRPVLWRAVHQLSLASSGKLGSNSKTLYDT